MIDFFKRVFAGKENLGKNQTSVTNSTETTTAEEPGKTPSSIKKGSCDCELCGCLCGCEDYSCCF